MAETDKKIEAMEQEVSEAVNPQADAPKKNAVAAEPTHLKNDAQDLGPAVVKPTDSNPDASNLQNPFLVMQPKKVLALLTQCQNLKVNQKKQKNP